MYSSLQSVLEYYWIQQKNYHVPNFCHLLGGEEDLCSLSFCKIFICSPIYLKLMRTESTAVIAQDILYFFVCWKNWYEIILLNCHASPSSVFQSPMNYSHTEHEVSTPVLLLLFFIWRDEARFLMRWSGIKIICFHQILSVIVNFWSINIFSG